MSDEVIDAPATEVSALEKIAGMFSKAAPQSSQGVREEVAEDAQTDESDVAELLWGDKTYSVPKELKDAFMRNDDYTKKTQELADQRRSLEQVRELAQTRQLESAFIESISAEQQEIAVIDAYLQQAQKMDWSQMNTDQMLRAKVEIDNVKERKALLRESIEGKRGKFQQDVRSRMDDLKSKSREMASKSIPNYGEDTDKSMRAFAKAEGLSESEIDNVLLDARSQKIIWKAMQFDKVQANTGKAVETVRTLKPGVAGERMPEDVKSRLAYGKAMKGARTSGDKAQIIEQRMARVFAKR